MSRFAEEISKLSKQRLALLCVELQRELHAARQSRPEPIAIIGLGCRLPGGVNGPEEFWHLLENGIDAIGPIPSDRWNVDEVYDPVRTAPGKIYTRSGGFVDRVDEFDPEFFGISPREARHMDPQHRLLLEVAWEALEHAGQPIDQLAGSASGVFIGIGTYDYATWTSPPFAPGFGLTELVSSWTAETPAGTWIQVEMRGTTTAGTTSVNTTTGTTTAGTTTGSTAVAGVQTGPQTGAATQTATQGGSQTASSTAGAGVQNLPSTNTSNDATPLALLGVTLMAIGGALLRRSKGISFR